MKKPIFKFNKITYEHLETMYITNDTYSGTEFMNMLKTKCEDLSKLYLEFGLISDSYYDECSHSVILDIYMKVEENA